MTSDIQFSLIQTIVLWAIPLLFAITAHEAAHGIVANALGDPTAKILGRLTLNPLKHIDLVGTILLPALTVYIGGVIFGYAKPVPISARNFKNIRRDMALTALAGPLSNLLMAFLWAAIAKSGQLLQPHYAGIGVACEVMGKIGIRVNVILFILNLLPLPPLDGGRVASSLLPGKLGYYFGKLENYGFIILIILLATGILSKILGLPYNLLVVSIDQLFGL